MMEIGFHGASKSESSNGTLEEKRKGSLGCQSFDLDGEEELLELDLSSSSSDDDSFESSRDEEDFESAEQRRLFKSDDYNERFSIGDTSATDDEYSPRELNEEMKGGRRGWRKKSRRGTRHQNFEVEEVNNNEVDELIVDSFNDHYSEGWKTKALNMVFQLFLFGIAAILLVWAVQSLFPDLRNELKVWGDWANSTGTTGAIVFSVAAGFLMLIPGVPGSLLCFSCGTLFPFGKALFIAAVGHHLGACLAFGIARLACRTRFERLLLSRPTLKTMSIAAKVEQWKVTFLSRFIVIPVQVKNYLFGVLPVSFPCFFWMALLGDFQSTLFSVYLGSISQNLLDEVENAANPKKQLQKEDGVLNVDKGMGGIDTVQPTNKTAGFGGWIPVASLILAIVMTTVASYVARKAYLQVLYDIKEDQAALHRYKSKRKSSSVHEADAPSHSKYMETLVELPREHFRDVLSGSKMKPSGEQPAENDIGSVV